MKKKKRVGLRILVAVLFLLFVGIGFLYLHSVHYTIPPQATHIDNDTGLIQAHGRSLYDANGDPIVLQGVNAGQILLQEGWMSPFALEPLKNEDGSYQKDADSNIQYPAFSEEEFRRGIRENPNLKDYDEEALMRIFWDSFFTEEDFRIIKEDLLLNTVRLPFYYLNILNDDLSPKTEEAAFSYLDWFVSTAAKYELYVVLDLHGAPGSQNGYEHSGTLSETAGLWSSQENMDATLLIWDMISEHYTHTRPDLGKWIATYDILNEPMSTHKGITTKVCWDFFDRVYDAVRENGDAHVITMEACWDFGKLPNPEDYQWKNVQYEYHWYNWWPDILPYRLFYMYQDLLNLGKDHDVPVFIGEFSAFEDKNAWNLQLDIFRERNYSWTVWNYKTCVTGWWTSSWGVYTCQLQLPPENEALKCNISTCTYEEYLVVCQKVRTENCEKSTLYDVLHNYTRQNPS